MSVVFTDNYTVGADANIDAYPSGDPDYAYNWGATTDMKVIATTDRVEQTVQAATKAARIIDASVPTGDQQVEGDFFWGSSYSCSISMVRMATSGTLTNSYQFAVAIAEGNEVRIHRWDDGSAVLLASADRGFTGGNETHAFRFKVTGSGATVSLEGQVDATAVLTYDDTNANRKTSGVPGIGGFITSGNNVTLTIDNLEIDDLVTAARRIFIA